MPMTRLYFPYYEIQWTQFVLINVFDVNDVFSKSAMPMTRLICIHYKDKCGTSASTSSHSHYTKQESYVTFKYIVNYQTIMNN